VPRGTVAKLVKDSVSIGLLHLGMDIIARIAQLSDLLCEQLDAIDRVAKDDALIDFEFCKERMEAVHLLSLFDVRIELRDTSERQFIHEIDAVGVRHSLLAEILDSDRKGGTKEADLVGFVT
jgi:hypothetical protein